MNNYITLTFSLFKKKIKHVRTSRTFKMESYANKLCLVTCGKREKSRSEISEITRVQTRMKLMSWSLLSQEVQKFIGCRRSSIDSMTLIISSQIICLFAGFMPLQDGYNQNKGITQ